MDNRFRLDGAELGLDLRASFASVDDEGYLDGRITAASVPGSVTAWATVPPRILLARIPLRFDGEAFGATLDQELLDELVLDDGGCVLVLSSRFDVFGRLTSHAGDLLRLRGTVETPWSPDPWRLDVALTFGGRRRAAI